MAKLLFKGSALNSVKDLAQNIKYKDTNVESALDSLNNDKIKIVTSSATRVEIEANKYVSVGVVNNLITIPTGYSIASITPYSESDGNCIPFIRREPSSGALIIYARNVSSGYIATNVYVRVLLIKTS